MNKHLKSKNFRILKIFFMIKLDQANAPYTISANENKLF